MSEIHAVHAGTGALATPEQRLIEERALAIYDSAAIAEAKEETLALFRADRNAKLLDQEAMIVRSVDEHYFHACLVAVNETPRRSEEHTSELQSLMRISYAVFCLKKKKERNNERTHIYIS